MRSSTIALALISSVVAVDFFGVDLSAGCVDYIKKSDPIVAKVGPQFLALEEAGRGSSVEQPAAEANAAVQSALKLYNAQKDGTLNQATLAQDKLEVQKDLKKIKPAIAVILAATDTSPAMTESIRALNATKAEAISYGRGGLAPCFTSIAAIKKAAADAQGVPAARFDAGEGFADLMNIRGGGISAWDIVQEIEI